MPEEAEISKMLETLIAKVDELSKTLKEKNGTAEETIKENPLAYVAGVCRGADSWISDSQGKRSVQQSVIDFLRGFSNSIIQGLCEAHKAEIGNDIVEGIEKFRKKLLVIGVAVSLAGTGIFLTLLGIASAIDSMFAMHGLGFVLIGMLAVLSGAVIYKR